MFLGLWFSLFSHIHFSLSLELECVYSLRALAMLISYLHIATVMSSCLDCCLDKSVQIWIKIIKSVSILFEEKFVAECRTVQVPSLYTHQTPPLSSQTLCNFFLFPKLKTHFKIWRCGEHKSKFDSATSQHL